MGPLGILRRESQADHDYRILREEEFRGEEALVIEAVPKPGVPLQHLFGRIWLRKTDAGILKIEWNPASIGNYLIVAETALRLDMTPDLLIIMEYALEKNGVRFPSRYTAKEIYRGENERRPPPDIRGRRHLRSVQVLHGRDGGGDPARGKGP
jgi:hypothetical protein